ncbi:hypothetical protein [Sinorhizobium meliloti]|uniref:hypothetical protein n=1 Tax=Rhizobium meliloti TaxID=382 RepID=UPI0001E4AB52|nr:hypothetical protein [Sinorhizobium meliloti]AEG53135.1 hypothetical protein Sinme_1388 [Sinorhizobium meliloti AK83]MDE4591150.1 hypothetical protein [Sinorhizobium meliloti]SEI55841.1 hypothetical protein SAMN04244575_01036 [Sinorhizobium meliloti]
MSNEVEKQVVYAYLRSQLQVAHEAIAAIWQVNMAIVRDHADGADLDTVIADATKYLPPELRTEDMPPIEEPEPRKKQRRRTAKPCPPVQLSGDFDDIFGG